jgi:hypothetical protein
MRSDDLDHARRFFDRAVSYDAGRFDTEKPIDRADLREAFRTLCNIVEAIARREVTPT